MPMLGRVRARFGATRADQISVKGNKNQDESSERHADTRAHII